ncbi:hypothetical protein [Arthrobacter sp. zg-Y877]|uniref:hypothetical protein n=1 Tax=Arthrobacter sp. zg-Y877 TaxID=3049074 RepID=UPI0025A406CA|nr:hypothetical protein [Arthrobacter sp. zg-Y877]MDM7991628.1 hypothetical protein [Arthrobacter sp. zg-Y877]
MLVMQGIGLVFTIVAFAAALSELDGRYGTEIATVLVVGIVGGTLIRWLVHEGKVAIVLVLLVVAEVVLLQKCPSPWSGLWPVLVPGSAIGVLVGAAIRTGVRQSRPKPRDVWVVNGIEDPRSDSAKAKALDALPSWDAGDSGAFRVQRNDAEFTAVGSSQTGFIVHSTTNSRDEHEWRMLGTDDADVVEIRLLSGPAFAPRGVLSDLATTRKALLGFFHHRGPDPQLPWSVGEDVRTYRFDQMPHHMDKG